MPQKTNLNISPYYDDFNADDNFYKVLFRPGRPVQARELTTLQSILQNQVESFGDHMFKEGTMVIPGSVLYDSQYFSVKIESEHLGLPVSLYLSQLKGKKLKGQNSGVEFIVNDCKYPTDSTDITHVTLFIKYLTGNNDNLEAFVSDNEPLIAQENIVYGNTTITVGDSVANAIDTDAAATGSAVKIETGVYFIRGSFVTVTADTIILDPYSNQPSYRVGLSILETIVTAKEDSELYDNARGFSNYAAPGADRLKISTKLSTKLITDHDDKTFVELMRVENGVVKKLQNKSEYSLIRDYFAKRTYEESGDYTVGNFTVDVKDTLNDRRGNGGIYYSNQETQKGNTPSEDLMGVSVSPGKAYIRGYDVETQRNKIIDVEKPRDKQKIATASVPFEMGTLFRVNNVTGTPIIDNNIAGNTVALHSRRRTSSMNATGGTKIGAARVYTFNLTDGTFVDRASKWDLYLYDIQTYTAIVLNQQISVTQTERVRGISSGATGYIENSGTTTSTNLNLIGTSGTFIGGEKLIFNEDPDVTRVLNSSTVWDISDVKSIIQDSPSKNSVYKTHFIADMILDASNDQHFGINDTINIDAGGLATVPGKVWNNIEIDDIVAIQQPGQASQDAIVYNRVNAIGIGATNVTLTSTDGVSNVSDGSLRAGAFSSFNIVTPTVRQSGGLYAKLDNKNVESINLTGSQLYINKQVTEETSSGGVLTINTSQLTGFADSLFQPFDAERYSIHFANDTTETLTDDQVVLSNNGGTITFSGLSINATNNVTVNTTIKKPAITSKTKEYVRSQKVEVTKCVSAATTALSGLSTSVYYGMRVEDQEISLNLPDAVKIVGVYESLDENALTLDTLDFPAGLSLDTSSILGEAVLGADSGTYAQITNRVSATRIEIAYLNSEDFVAGELVTFEESNISANLQTINKGNNQNVTNHYDLDKGHKDTILDYSRIVRKNDGYKPTHRLLAIFDYYNVPADDTGDVFTVNSYPKERFSNDIPHLPDGTRASDLLDFRPRVAQFTSSTASPFAWNSRDVGGTSGNPTLVIAPGEASSLGYDFYLPRIDRLVLNTRGKFQVIKGTSSLNPTYPVNEEEVMDIARIELPAYLYDVDDAVVRVQDNRRYTMRDIGKLEDRIEHLEDVTSLSLLELSTQTLQVRDADGLDRFKTGFFVDDFKDSTRLDIRESKMTLLDSAAQLTAPIDFDFVEPLVALDPSIDVNTADYSQNLDLLDSNVQKTGELVTLKYDQVTFLDQPLASRVENVNPFNMLSWTGRVTLNPQSDNWVRSVYIDGGERHLTGDRSDPFWGWSSGAHEFRNPATQFEFTETHHIGRAPDKYIRSRNVRFTAAGLRPYTRMYPFFDSTAGIDVVPKLVEITMNSGSFQVGETVLGFHPSRYNGNHQMFTARLKAPNHKSGVFNSGAPRTYGKNPYDRSIALGTAYSASSTVLNIDIPALSKEALGRWSGYVVKGMTILGTTSGAQATVTDVRLINDNWGDIEGSFFFRNPHKTHESHKHGPPLKWTTGQKQFKLTSSSTDAESLPGSLLISKGETAYWTSGIVDTYRQTRVVVRRPPPPPYRVSPDGDNADPLAQSFTTEREGMFLTSVDLFFGHRDEQEQLTVELRNVELGTPTGELVQDFARVILNPEEINISDDGTKATNVRFPSPIYLGPQTEYAIVILAPSTNQYEAWIARMGEKTVGTSNLPDDENVIVTKQYIGGSLFKSQNGTIWTANQFEDLKFKLYKAKFVKSGTLTFYNPALEDGDWGRFGLLGDAVRTLPRKLKVGFEDITGVPGVSGTAAPLVVGAKVADGNTASDAYGYIEAVGGSANDLAISAGGSGYTQQTATAGVELYPISSQERTKGQATVTVNAAGAVSAITINTSVRGAGYKVGDVVGIKTGDLTGDKGTGAKITISTIHRYNTFFLTDVKGEQFNFSGSTDIFVNDTQFNSGSTHFASSVQNGSEYGGNVLEVQQYLHGMHGSNNVVTLRGIGPNSIPTSITSNIGVNDGASGSISVANTSLFATYEGITTSMGYAQINNEIVYYSGITAGGGGAGTIGIGTRGVDGTVARGHNNGAQIQTYELNGVGLRRLNKKHSTSAIMDSPKTFDKYYLQFDRASEDKPRNSGDDLLNFNNENSLGGDNLYGTKNLQFNQVTPRLNIITPGDGTSINAKMRTISGTSAGGVEPSFVDQGYEPIELNNMNNLTSTRLIASQVNETQHLATLTKNKSFTMSLDLSSINENVSPVVDLDNTCVIVSRARVDRPVIDYASDGASNSITEDPHGGIYVTKGVTLKQPATSLKVIVAAYRHSSADFRVLYQLLRTDSEAIDQTYVAFPGYDNLEDTDGDGFGDRIIDSSLNSGRPDAKVNANAANEFSEYQFSVDNLEPFIGFKVKIVMSGTNEAYAPRFQDFRAIALA